MSKMNLLKSMIFNISSRNDVLLAALLISVIFMMVIPLPTVIVDMLITLNIVIAALLLMLSIYISSPLQFSSFPSVLLITTVFRLALSITTTRLILLNADAGHIVFVFGNFVVRGNLIVGIVIFLIITIVQFIVITKGSERVAEVAARFSLDAMPGKQMSIDSDLRAGIIESNQAKQKREDVQMESQMYGAMDGAMKFVKGDAIAGLIIIFVNLIGGVSIGIAQKSMSFSDAINLYAILTIGDGLVSQIPALFISITSGIVVTRVSSNESMDLGKKIGQQVTAQPKALIIAGLICCLFAFVPGMPYIIFIIFAALLVLYGVILLRNTSTHAGQIQPEKKSVQIESKRTDTESHEIKKISDFAGQIELKGKDFIAIAPCMIQISSNLISTIKPSVLESFLESKRVMQYLATGVPYPRIAVRVTESANTDIAVYIYEVVRSSMHIDPNYQIICDNANYAQLTQIDIRPIELGLIDHINSYYYVHNDLLYSAKKIGFNHISYGEAIALHACSTLSQYNDKFIGIQESYELLERVKRAFPELIQEVYKVLNIQKIADILRRLSSEYVPIRNMRVILEAMVEWAPKERDVVLLTEYIRGSIGDEITQKYSKNNTLLAYVASPSLDQMITDSVRHTSSGSYLAMEPEQINSVSQYIKNIVKDKIRPVILISMESRRFLKKLLSSSVPDAVILSFQEITPGIDVQAIQTINPQGMIE